MSLFTGTFPSRHRVTRSQLRLDPSLTTLMAFLRQKGYATYGVSSNFWLSRASGFDRDFDCFYHSWQLLQAEADRSWQRQRAWSEAREEAEVATSGWRERVAPFVNGLYFQVAKRLRGFSLGDDGAWRVNQLVRSWIPAWRQSQQPFFAFIHYMEPHLRYQAPGRFHSLHLPQGVTRSRIKRINQNPWRYVAGQARMSPEDFSILAGLYDGELSYTDYRVRQIYDLLKENDLLNDTMLIITSDHGENLGDHGLMDHQYCVYDSLLRVPLVIRYPRCIPPNTRVTSQVQLVDLFPTILRILESEDAEVWEQIQGQSILPDERDGRGDRSAFAEYLEPCPPLRSLQKRYPGFDGSRYDRKLRAIRTPRYKYIWASDGRDELYDVASDPGETMNMIEAIPQVAAELRAEMEGQLSAEFIQVDSVENIALAEDIRKRLEGLGYL
jgi:arylsulfatase A-like enzyme